VAGGVGNEVGEPLERDHVAVLQVLRHRVMKAKKPCHFLIQIGAA
jgi:hypothetical protein